MKKTIEIPLAPPLDQKASIESEEEARTREQREMKQEAKLPYERLASYVNGEIHDANNNLMALGGFLELMVKSGAIDLKDEQLTELKVILSESRQISEMLKLNRDYILIEKSLDAVLQQATKHLGSDNITFLLSLSRNIFAKSNILLTHLQDKVRNFDKTLSSEQASHHERLDTILVISNSLQKVLTGVINVLDGKSTTENEPTLVNISKFFRRWKDPLQFFATKGQNKVEFSFKNLEMDQNLSIRVSDEDLGRVLENLVKNANYALAGKEGAKISVTVRREQQNDVNFIAIEVADNGVGIPVENIEKIFSENFTTKGSEGDGKGLWLAKKFAELSGGKLEVKSQSGNTVFKISLPEAFAKQG